MRKRLSISKAKEQFATLVDTAVKRKDEYVIMAKGKPAAVLLSFDEYDSLQETLDVLSDPDLMESIRQGEKDIAAGRLYDWEDVKKELGINVPTPSYSKSKKATQKHFRAA